MRTEMQQSRFAYLLRALSFSGRKLFFPWALPMLAFVVFVNLVNINLYGIEYIIEFNSKYLNIIWGLVVILTPWLIVTMLISLSMCSRLRLIVENGGVNNNDMMEKIFLDVLHNR
jgi:hypothetical protein